MRQVAPAGEVHAEKRVARLQKREEHRLVRVSAGMGLHVCEAAIEQTLGAIDGQPLDFIDEFAAAIIAPARIAFSILVGQHRALRFQHRARDDVLRGDQLDLPLLAFEFIVNGRGHVRIGSPNRRLEKSIAFGRAARTLIHGAPTTPGVESTPSIGPGFKAIKASCSAGDLL